MNPSDCQKRNAVILEEEETGFDMFSFEDPFLSMIDLSSGERVAFRLSQIRSIIHTQDFVSVCVNCEALETVAIARDTGAFLEGLLSAYVGFIDLDKKTATTLEQ